MKKIYTVFLFVFFISISAFAQVSVTASTGTTGPTSYTTVKAAFDAINNGVHTGTVVVSLTGNTTESASAILNSSGTGAASYTGVTVRPATGVTAQIAGTVDGPVIRIRGSNVTLDGSNNASTSRNLTISNSDTSEAKIAAVAISSTGTNQVSGVTVRNAIISKGLVGILVSDVTPFTEGVFNNITIQNNDIRGSFYGIIAMSAVGTGNGVFNINQNILTATGADAIYGYGIYLQGGNGATISGNQVGNFNATEEGDDIGIWLASGSSNTLIEKNRVFNIGHSNGDGYGGHGIRVSTGITNANVTVANNMISNMYGDGWNYQSTQYALDNPIGILLNSTQTGINLYYNSIHLYGNTLNETGAMSAGIYLGAGSVANIKNNIVVNNLGLTGTDGHGSVAIFLASANTQLADVNYNNYFVAPTGTGVKNIGQVAGTGSATLTAWVTASGKEANSMNIQPVFVSNTDLHLNPASNEGLSNKGTPIGGIATDYDGDTRSTSTPDPGADEFLSTVACTNPVITTQPSSVTTCLQQNVNFTVAATGTNLTYQWRKDNVNISGATAASYAVNNITAASAGSYTVQVSSGSCVVTSNAAVLTVSGPCTSLPTVDTEITSVVLMPNVVNNATTLRVQATRTMKIRWNVVDMNGKVVMNFDNQVTAGRNDIQVIVSKLGAGSYQIVGQTSKGRTEVVKFIKQ